MTKIKVKLISLILMFILVMSIMIVSVLSLTQANVPMGGTINFSATNVYAKVSAQIENAQETPTLPELIFSENESEASSESNINQWKNLNLTFDSSATPITIEITVENLSTERKLGVSLTNETATGQNVIVEMDKNSQILEAKPETGTSVKTFTITFSVEDPNEDVTNAVYNLLVTLTDESQSSSINVLSNNTSLGSVNGSGKYMVGEEVTLTATPNGSTFLAWAKVNGESEDYSTVDIETMEIVSTLQEYTFTIEDLASQTYYALFNTTESTNQTGGDLVYTFYNEAKLAEITDTKSTSVPAGDYTISSTVTSGSNAYKVFSIGDSAFYDCSGLTSITIPESIAIIDSAFTYCSSLTSITIPEGVTTIEPDTFLGCRSLTSITLPSTLTTINYYAFYDCSSLTSITIPEGVTTIDFYAFFGCRSLTSITIPERVTTIGTGTFSNCNSLTSITIPEGGTTIGDSAFYSCSNLTSITLPSTLEAIGASAFNGCYALSIVKNNSSLNITKGSTDYGYVGYYAKEIVTSTNPQVGRIETEGNIQYYVNEETRENIAFAPSVSRDSLTTATIREGTTEINQYAFYNCISLTSITIPEGVTTIGDSAFEGCYALSIVKNNSSLDISIGSTDYGSIGNYAKEIVTATNPQVGRIETEGNIQYYVNETTEENIALAPSISRGSLITATIREGTTEINQYAFYNCINLASITLPNTLKTIGNEAFYYCSSLTSITIPEGVTTIGDSIFYNCRSLASITLPSTLTTIGNEAFFICSDLAVIVVGAGSNLTTSFSTIRLLGTWYKDGAVVTAFSGGGTYAKAS